MSFVQFLEVVDTDSRQLIFIKKPIAEEPLNLGKEMARWSRDNLGQNHFSQKFLREAQNVIAQRIIEHESLGTMIYLSNIGILFESELKINIHKLFSDLLRESSVILEWPGEIVNNKAYFLSEGSEFFIDLSTIRYQVI